MQLPARYTPPLSPDFITDGDTLIKLAGVAWTSPESAGRNIELDDWQKWLLRHILERYPEDHPTYPGRLRYRQVVVSIPRQVGKSLIGGLLAGLYGFLAHVPGARILSLASTLEQANIIYDRVLFAIKNNQFLATRFKRATETRGIVSADGSGRYQIMPAKESALQGHPISLCLFDELHIAKPGMWSAAVLGTQARTDGIVIGITTAGDDTSRTLLDLYKVGEQAIAGDPDLERFGFFCWEAPPGSAVDDPEAIKIANPAVECGRIPLADVLAGVRTMPEHEARRYVLNQFISGAAQSWLPSDLFTKAAGKGITNLDRPVLAIDRTKNLEHATIAAAVKIGEKYETELVASINQPTEDKLFDLIQSLYLKHAAGAIALDSGAFPGLAKRLKGKGYKVYELWHREVSTACSSVYAMFARGAVTHANDPLLKMQMPRGVSKYQGETWKISRKDSIGDIDAVYATVLALYVASLQHAERIQVF
jgi:phage terminase large subunit-like protein